jgi:hypothetical protein
MIDQQDRKPKAWRLPLIIGIGIGILGLPLLTLRRQSTKMLSYHGKSIDYWFAQLPVTPVPPPGIDLGNIRGFIKSTGQQYGSTNLADGGAIEAFDTFGTNALPFLLARLRELDSKAEQNLTQAATNAGLNYTPFRNADVERLQAVTALIRAKTLTPEATQTIAALRTNANADVASAARYILDKRAK